jgi:hypothetical protein
MRQSSSTVPFSNRTSHSSRHQLASDHHCPLTRTGPAESRTTYAAPSQKTRTGAWFASATPTMCGGRETRRATGVESDCLALRRGGGGSNETMRKAFGRWSSVNSGEPTRCSPRSFRIRASITSSCPGSGACGRKRPCCARYGAADCACSSKPTIPELTEVRSRSSESRAEVEDDEDRSPSSTRT